MKSSLCDGVCLVQTVLVDEEELQPPVGVDLGAGAGEHYVDLVLVACRDERN